MTLPSASFAKRDELNPLAALAEEETSGWLDLLEATRFPISFDSYEMQQALVEGDLY